MKRFLIPTTLAIVATAAFASDNTLTTEEQSSGWKLLFDGKDASQLWRGFKKETIPAGWVVADGALFRENGGGDIISKEQFENFELSIEWKISPGGNSGIMFRVQETENTPWKTGPEIQILDNVGGHDPNKAGWMYALYPASVDATKPVGEWNHFRFITQNGKCQHWMNGVKYVEYEIGSTDWDEKVAKTKFAQFPGFGKSPKGHICLQDHGNQVWFKNIKIRPL
ncbi:MAG: DUF1080 domain-containing protein [Verrucomicrobiota bacterium]